MNVFKSISVIGLLFLASMLQVSAQTSQLETDQGIAASIAPYDADVRLAILKASEYPEVLTQLQKNQSQSVASFQKTIGGFSKKKQTWFYTLTRYPDLMHTLATLPDGKVKMLFIGYYRIKIPICKRQHGNYIAKKKRTW